MCVWYRLSTLLLWWAQQARARMASLIYLQLAVRACVFAHIYISLPLIIHLASFKGALQSQRAVLGFITFISCISPAGLANNASLKHSLAEERGLPLSQGRLRAAFCPGQAPPDFLLCIQIEWTLCQVGYLLTYKVGNESKAWERAIMMPILKINMCLLKTSNSLL